MLREATEPRPWPAPVRPARRGVDARDLQRSRESADPAPPPALRADLGGVRAPCATDSGSRRAKSTLRRRSSRCAPICRPEPSPASTRTSWPGFAMADSVRAGVGPREHPAARTRRSSRRGRRLRRMPRPAANSLHGRCSWPTGSPCCGPILACRAHFLERTGRPTGRSRSTGGGADDWMRHPPPVRRDRRGRPTLSRAEARSKIRLAHLPGRRPRQLVDDDDVLRDLVARDRAVEVLADIVGVDLGALAHRDAPPTAPRPTARRGTPITATPVTPSMSLMRFSISAGIDVLAARDDHVLEPVGDVEVAVRVEVAEVARAEPAVVGETPPRSPQAGCGTPGTRSARRSRSRRPCRAGPSPPCSSAMRTSVKKCGEPDAALLGARHGRGERGRARRGLGHAVAPARTTGRVPRRR